MSESLGDRMKGYELAESGRRLMPLLTAVARIDGRNFSSFTRGLARPYDERFSRVMLLTTQWLARETAANVGYTQSDEISLAWYRGKAGSQIFFDGRVQKMTSQLAALATVCFNTLVPEALGMEYRAKWPTFDARVWNVPTLEEAASYFLWREQDAAKNSVGMAARHYYSHAQVADKHQAQLMDMLMARGVNWNDYPEAFKRGIHVVRRSVERPYTPEERETLPALHEARRDPDVTVRRADYVVAKAPPLGRVVNRVGFLFRGEEPATAAAAA